MNYQPDIAITDRYGSPVAVIEVKALTNLDAQRAVRYMKNLLTHGFASRTQYVMLITRDMGYLWTQPASVLNEAIPDLKFPMNRIIQQYVPTNGTMPAVHGGVLEAIVVQWLSDLAAGVPVDDRAAAQLAAHGFVEAVHSGTINALESV